jgi:hypothetical protein
MNQRHAKVRRPKRADGFFRRTTCRICDSKDLHEFLSLGEVPLANAFLRESDLNKPEPRFPLSAHYCAQCGLVQVLDVVDPRLLFSHYAYFSSASKPMVEHFASVAAEIHARYLTKPGDLLVEIGSNDGTFLKNLLGKSRLLGVDPAANIAEEAAKSGITTIKQFFNADVATYIRHLFGPAKVVFAANCFAHTDDIADTLRGVTTLLDTDGVLVFEDHRFASVLRSGHFDQFYHEHLNSYTLRPLEHLMERFGMKIIDARVIPTHGGSFEIHAARVDSGYRRQPSVAKVRADELALGLDDPRTYAKFAADVKEFGKKFGRMLKGLKNEGSRIAGYGATAKSTTLLNYCGIDNSILDYVVDSTPRKQGCYTPGTHIPILPPEAFRADKPDYVVLLAWNYADVILDNERAQRERGVKFILPEQELKLL